MLFVAELRSDYHVASRGAHQCGYRLPGNGSVQRTRAVDCKQHPQTSASFFAAIPAMLERQNHFSSDLAKIPWKGHNPRYPAEFVGGRARGNHSIGQRLTCHAGNRKLHTLERGAAVDKMNVKTDRIHPRHTVFLTGLTGFTRFLRAGTGEGTAFLTAFPHPMLKVRIAVEIAPYLDKACIRSITAPEDGPTSLKIR